MQEERILRGHPVRTVPPSAASQARLSPVAGGCRLTPFASERPTLLSRSLLALSPGDCLLRWTDTSLPQPRQGCVPKDSPPESPSLRQRPKKASIYHYYFVPLAGVAIITTATRKQPAIPAKLIDLESIKPRLTVIEYAAISQFCGKMAFKYIIGLAGSFPWL